MQDLSNLVVYDDGELELKVSIDREIALKKELRINSQFRKR